MKSIFEYEVLNNEVFYKGWHILEFIEKHPNMSELDKQAIKATIMDALVYHNLIDVEHEFLSLEQLAITNNSNDYHYEKYPNVCGIPLWMRDKLRRKSIYIAGGIPISLLLAKPASKTVRYCVYDPNTAVSSIFEDFTFYETIYTSPTRGIRLEQTRSFVEVPIDEELYLVDTITNRIFKSSYFKEQYDLEIIDRINKKDFNAKQREIYAEHTQETCSLGNILPLIFPIIEASNNPNLAEYKYEFERSKELFPEEWEKSKQIIAEIDAFSIETGL